MVSFEEQQRILHAPFDIETHRHTFIDYLEIIIKPDGTPEYAVPSHMLKLVSIYSKCLDKVYEEYLQAQSGLDAIDWLCLKTGCISVWQYHIQGLPNDAQRATLQRLHDAGLYTGLLHPSSEIDIRVQPDRF